MGCESHNSQADHRLRDNWTVSIVSSSDSFRSLHSSVGHVWGRDEKERVHTPHRPPRSQNPTQNDENKRFLRLRNGATLSLEVSVRQPDPSLAAFSPSGFSFNSRFPHVSQRQTAVYCRQPSSPCFAFQSGGLPPPPHGSTSPLSPSSRSCRDSRNNYAHCTVHQIIHERETSYCCKDHGNPFFLPSSSFSLSLSLSSAHLTM